jgi:raffinose/stachyose/melibiose transport system permease protein
MTVIGDAATTTTSAGTTAGSRTGRTGTSRVEGTFYAFLLPAITLFTLFITMPAVVGAFYSLTDYVGFGEWSFIGLANFAVLFSDPRILSAYGFTLGFSVVTVLLVNALALLIALGLNARIGLKTALRAIFFVPMVVSGIVIAYVFKFLFSTSLPEIAATLGIDSLRESILANPDLAWVAIVVVTAWQQIPSALIIYLAGLLAVPEEVYEAATLDGATAWKQFSSITLPLIAGYVVINTVLGFKNLINAYDIIVGLTNGGPGTATMSVAMTIFTGFTGGDYAYQMANALVFFVVTLAVSVLQLLIIRRRGVSI